MLFCSICYKAEELRIRNTTTSHELISGSASHEQNGQDELNAVGSKKPSNPGRCFQCNKKIGISGFKCRCDYTFCASHRQYNKHNCTFDFKSHSREALSKANPAVIADKIEKIWKMYKSSNSFKLVYVRKNFTLFMISMYRYLESLYYSDAREYQFFI